MKSELYELSENVQPFARLRRLRQLESLRSLLRETRLSSLDFMYPIFVDHRLSKPEPLSSMPGISRLSLGDLKQEVAEIVRLSIPAVLVFGLPKRKDALGSEAYATDTVVQQAVRNIKKAAPHLVVATDICLCGYTDHGHCGVVREGKVDNDETLQLLARMAVSHAEAGADIVAPSAMMDGQVGAIRQALDRRGLKETLIMGYSAKFASGFYGPFREAAESTPLWGDRRSYQMDSPNRREAMREIESDIEEGADIVMVKPALSYLDLIREARDQFKLPLAAYNVSGEYSMIKAAGEKGWLDDRRIAMEVLTAIKRAGANIIITYFAKDAAKWLEETK
ncbi:MAG TPA: porphobilinogen synthase [Candidatus Acidoferrales bacterium]|nr:porphobilinogen synthase [Candidatus Acidoferrales bacterium]